MDASTLIDLALSLLGLTTLGAATPDDGTDPDRSTRPVGG
jgi:hypothetical protein